MGQEWGFGRKGFSKLMGPKDNWSKKDEEKSLTKWRLDAEDVELEGGESE